MAAAIPAIQIAATVLGGISAVKSFMGSGKSDAAPPMISAPPIMPTPDDTAVKAARKRSLQAASQRGGRQSTILSDPLAGGDLLGG